MTTQTMDQAKAEAFAGKMLGLLNDSMLGLMVSIGHQTGLYDAMAKLPPSTSKQIAKAAKLNERYVREWLGAMVTGGIVHYEPKGQTYRLAPEHAAFLTRAAGQNNLAFFATYLSVLGDVEQKVIKAFKNGGGVPYSEYPRFQAVQGEESAMLYDSALIPVVLPMVPGLTERLKQGIAVADVGCGQGHAVNVMAKAFPKSTFVGYDFSKEGIAAAKAEAKKWRLKNARFEVKDIGDLRGEFDFITALDTIHNQAKPMTVLKKIRAALKPGGDFLMMDIAGSSNLEENVQHPLGPTLYAVSTLHCMTVSLAYKGEGLGTVWGEQKAQAYLTKAGFKNIVVKHIEGDPMHAFFVAKK